MLYSSQIYFGCLMNHINLNARPDPLLSKLPQSEGFVTRVTLIAIPFLSLYTPTRMGVSVVAGSVQIISLCCSKQSRKEKLFKASAYAVMIYLSIYRPKVALAMTLSVQTVSDIKERKIYDILSRIVYFYSIYSNRPEIIVGSLLLEIGKELKDVRKEYEKERYIEAVAKLLMAALRTCQTKEEISRVSRRYFGKTVTQEDWDQLSKKEDISKALKEKNYSDVIKNIKVKTLPKRYLSKVKLEDMVFERVDFSESDLSDSRIKNVTFIDCNMRDILLYRVSLTQVVWNNCQLAKGTFYRCYGEGLFFNGCDLTRLCMSESVFSKLIIEASNLYGASFLNVLLQESFIKGCDLMNVLLCHANFRRINCTENKLTKPVIALTWDFYDRGSWGEPVPEVLEDQGALTLKFPIYLEDIDQEALKGEVKKTLRSHTSYRLSRAQELLDDKAVSPEIEIFKRRAVQVMSYANGVILSGGENVETEFYSDDFYGSDYRRSLMEFAVIHQGKPVMGICRGCQVVNAYFGGTIKNVSFQGTQEPLDYHTKEELGRRLKEKMEKPIVGYSAHGQAADKLGQSLKVILMKRGIVKAIANKNWTIIGTQFHPEKYIDGKNMKEKMEKADLKMLVSLIASQFLGEKTNFFQTGQLVSKGDTPRLNVAGEKAIIKYCNESLLRFLEMVKKLDSNQIFFQIFMEKVRVNRADSNPRPSASSLAG